MLPNFLSAFGRQAGLTIAAIGIIFILGGCQTPTQIVQSNGQQVEPRALDYREMNTGLIFPPQIGNMDVAKVNDYEQTSPGLGKGLFYRSPTNKLEIYVYDLGAAIIPNGIDSKAIRGAYYAAIADIKGAAKSGLYTDFSTEDFNQIELGNHPFLHTRFAYNENLSAKESHLLISGFNTKIIKIRLTLSKKDFSILDISLNDNPFSSERKQIFQQIEEIVSSAFRRGFTGVSNEELVDLQNKLRAVNLDNGISPVEAITIAQVELINKGYATEWNVMRHADISLSAISSYELSFPIRDRQSRLDTLQVWVNEAGAVTIEEKDIELRF